MGVNYYSIYQKRATKYGTTSADRIIGMRTEQFKDYLTKSVYTVNVPYGINSTIKGILISDKQTESRTLKYLLIETQYSFEGGEVLTITQNGDTERWMIYYEDAVKPGGYKKYIVLLLNEEITWRGADSNKYTSLVHTYGPSNVEIKDEIKSRSRQDFYYAENLKVSHIIMPLNENLNKQDYIEIQGYGYIVAGLDRLSVRGCQSITIDPLYKYDHSAPVIVDDTDDDTYWFKGKYRDYVNR